MRFEEGDQRRQQHRIRRAVSELIRPDSGQVEEPARPPLIAKRFRKRGKGKNYRIIWYLGRHSLPSNSRSRSKETNWPRS